MAPSTHFTLNTGAKIPAVGLGLYRALCARRLCSATNATFARRNLAVKAW